MSGDTGREAGSRKWTALNSRLFFLLLCDGRENPRTNRRMITFLQIAPLNPVRSFTIVISTAASDLPNAGEETLSSPARGCLQSCKNAPSKQRWEYLLCTILCALPGCGQMVLHFPSQAPPLLLWGRAAAFPPGSARKLLRLGSQAGLFPQQSPGLDKAVTLFLSFPRLLFFHASIPPPTPSRWRAPHLVSARLLLLVWHPLFTKQTECSF